MTDKHTLVERLNAWADSGDMGRGPDPTELRRLAATRITALEAREAELVGALTLALGEAESWIHDQLDGTSSLKGALADLAPARATLAKHQEGSKA